MKQSTSQPARHQSRLHALLASGLCFVVLAAPIPGGSNRPIFWLFWGGVLGVLLLLYLLTGPRMDHRLVPAHRVLPVYSWALALLLGYAVAQALPLAPYIPTTLLALPRDVAQYPASISLAPQASLIGALRLLAYAVFAVLVYVVAGNPVRAARMRWVLFAGITGHAVWALVSLNLLGDQFFWGEKTAYRGMATGTFIYRNAFAAFVAMGLSLGLSLYLAHGRSRQSRHAERAGWTNPITLERGLILLALAVLMIALLASRSRMGLAAGGFGLLIVAALHLMHGKAGLRRLAWPLAVAILIALATGRGVLERLVLLEVAGEDRRILYVQVWEMIRARPLTGYGLDAFAPAFALFHRPPLSPDLVWTHAHSTYLTLWAELGLVFGSLPLLLGLGVIWHLLRGLGRGRQNAGGIAALGAIGAVGLHATVDFTIEIQANMFLLLALVCLGLPRRSA